MPSGGGGFAAGKLASAAGAETLEATTRGTDFSLPLVDCGTPACAVVALTTAGCSRATGQRPGMAGTAVDCPRGARFCSTSKAFAAAGSAGASSAGPSSEAACFSTASRAICGAGVLSLWIKSPLLCPPLAACSRCSKKCIPSKTAWCVSAVCVSASPEAGRGGEAAACAAPASASAKPPAATVSFPTGACANAPNETDLTVIPRPPCLLPAS
jgi:hypothetical protein